MLKRQIAFWIVIAATTATVARCQSDSGKVFVYLIRIPATPHHKSAIQTGFRMSGVRGIITTLHGVADGGTFSAENESGDVLVNLSISKIEFSKDLALLTCPRLEARQNDGLLLSAGPILGGQKLHVWGHPLAINLYSKPVVASDPPSRQLIQLIPPASAAEFVNRKSPSTDTAILSLDGNLVPGDSGAPVLDSTDHVVGIEDGGLLGGAAGISWAIPSYPINWVDAKTASSALAYLASQDSANLFAFSDLIDEQRQRSINNRMAFRLGIDVAYRSYFDTSLSELPNRGPEPADFTRSMAQNKADIASLLQELKLPIDSRGLDFTSPILHDYQMTPGADSIKELIDSSYDEQTRGAYQLGLELEGSHWMAHKKQFGFSIMDHGFPADMVLGSINDRVKRLGATPQELNGAYLNSLPLDVNALNEDLERIFKVLESEMLTAYSTK